MIAGGANRERFTRSRRYAQWLLVFLIGAACGYGLRSPKERAAGNPGLVTASAGIATANSFSEIANTKEALNTLAYEFVTTSFNKHAPALAHKTAVATTDPEREAALGQYVAELKEGVEEFKGTEQEMRVFQRLLLALKGDARWSEWLDTYLHVLYRHPTHELVGNLATEAVGAASFTGRETELEQGLTHVLSIPLEFDSKPALEHALNQLSRPNQIAVMIGDASLLCLHN